MTGLCERCLENEAAINDVWCSYCILEVEMMLAEEAESNGDDQTSSLPRHFYTLEDLERWVAEYEDEYGLPSDALLAMHQEDKAPLGLSSFDRSVWLSYYREILEKRK